MIKFFNNTITGGFKKYFFNTSWLLAEKLLRIISAFAVGAWIARYLGPEDFGILNYVIAFSAFFGGITKLGLDGIVTRELINQPKKKEYILGTAFWMKLIASLVISSLVFFFLPFFYSDSRTNLYITIVVASLIFQSFEIIEFYFLSSVRGRIVSINKIIQILISNLLKIILILFKANLIWFILVLGLDILSLAISYIISYKNQASLEFLKYFKISIVRALLRDAWPLILSGIAITIYMRIDQIMIKELLGSRELGIYSVAVKLSEALNFIPMVLVSSLLPSIINAKNNDRILYKNRLQKLYTLVIWISISAAFFITFFADHLTLILFGEEYFDSIFILQIHIWSSVFVFIGVVNSNWHIVENLQRLVFLNTIIGAVMNIILNIILIRKLGVIGATYATLLSYAFSAFLLNIIWKESRSNFKLIIYSFLPFKANHEELNK